MSETRKIDRYFDQLRRRLARGRRERSAAERSPAAVAGDRLSSAGVARASGGVMGGAGLLEDSGDDLFQRRFLHAHVGHGVPVEDRRQHLGDLARARP